MARISFCFSAVLLVAGCGQEADPRGLRSGEVLLQVAATGRSDTKPDEARFTAGVETIASSAAEAGSRNSATIDRIGAALEKLGVKRDDLQTRAFNLGRIDYGPNRGSFRASNMIEVRVRDISRAGAAIAAATDTGANILSGPNLAISDPEAAGRSAYAQAYKAARARAETYAEAAGLKVARVLTIRDSGDRPSYGGMDGYASDAAMRVEAASTAAPPPLASPPPPPSPAIRAGTTTREVEIRAEFALGPK
jgi:hypothetical protein